MKPFKRRRRGGLHATFEPGEAHVIANLAAQVVELLRDRHGESQSDPDPLVSQLGLSGPLLPPDDPVLQRLLPDAYTDDEDDAAEFRRFTEQSLTSAKVANAEALIASLVAGGMEDDLERQGEEEQVVEVELDDAAVQAWLRSLTDIRLALSVRLGIETDEDSLLVHESEDESTVAVAEIYDWLGFVQETLIGALDQR